MNKVNYNILKLFKCILLLITLILLIVIIPRVVYKEPYNQDNPYQGTGINLKTKEASMGGSYVIEGKDKLEKFLSENNLNNISTDEIYLCGNTPYDEVTTYSEGIPQYYNLNIYGNFVDKEKDNLIYFEVIDWYPVNETVLLKDTYIWKNQLRYFFYLAIVINIILIIIIINEKNVAASK